MEVEGTEQNIILQPEGMIVGAVTSVNGQTGDVVLTTSDLENTSDYQTGADVQEAIAGKQDKLTAGNNIQISEQNVISATNTTYSAGNGINISGENAISVDTTVVATQQNLSDEVTNRENADIYLQGQIDAISASSDVVDIVGTYAELQAYDTQHLKDNDIIKVLQDETQGDATTYYRWSTSTQTFTLIGQEGPYYTKAGADAQFVPQTRTVNGKALSANITLNASDVSALGTSDVAQTTGSSTSMVMSQKATTDALDTKLNITDYVVDTQLADSDNPVQNRVLNGLLGDMPSDFFSGSATTSPTASTSVQFGNILNLDDVQLLGDTFQQTYSGTNFYNVKDVASASPSGVSVDDDGWITLAMNNTGSSTQYVNYYSNKLAVQTNTDYLIVVEIKDFTPGNNGTLSIAGTANTEQFKADSSLNISFSTMQKGVSTYIRKSVADFTGVTYGLRTTLVVSANTNRSVTFRISVLADTSITPATFVYQPFTGNIPAPNPDYPEPISVVTGVQTVTVSDGGSNTQTLAIDLGATELCKISDYQDYIYNSGDDWYVHKACGKVVFDGTETWTRQATSTSGKYRFWSAVSDIEQTILAVGYSNRLIPVTEDTYYQDGISGSSSRQAITIRYDSVIGSMDTTQLQTWLASNTLIAYYKLATPTDTQITDATLISELEALLSASTYDGKTDFVITATGTNLPAPLQLTAVNANAKGIIYKLRA